MCIPSSAFAEAAGVYVSRPRSATAGSGMPDPLNRPNVNPFIRGNRDGRSFLKNAIGRMGDVAFLKRQGLSEEEAKRLSRFAAHRGGLDAFDSIEDARRAMLRSGAFTDQALVPAATEQVSRFEGITPNTQRTGAAELRGLPLIRRG